MTTPDNRAERYKRRAFALLHKLRHERGNRKMSQMGTLYAWAEHDKLQKELIECNETRQRISESHLALERRIAELEAGQVKSVEESDEPATSSPDDRIMVFRYDDGDRRYVLDYLDNIFEFIRAGVSDTSYPPDEGQYFSIEVDYMTRAEFDALPEV